MINGDTSEKLHSNKSEKNVSLPFDYIIGFCLVTFK